jgi:hypothetical protein
VRKEGENKWIKAKDHPNLSFLFSDEEDEFLQKNSSSPINGMVLVKDMKSTPPYIDFLVLLLIILILWLIMIVFN